MLAVLMYVEVLLPNDSSMVLLLDVKDGIALSSTMETFKIRTQGTIPGSGDGYAADPLSALVPPGISDKLRKYNQQAIPSIAKDQDAVAEIESAIRKIPTTHTLMLGDARGPLPVADQSVHLVVTSPPYWTLKEYELHDQQLGEIKDYEDFLNQLDVVWSEVYRVLAPGGRLVIVVGDVCLSRRQFGRHVVFPLHASIQERCRGLGFDNLAPIIWHKISNAKTEAVGNGSTFLGKPYEPNAIIKNDIEYILFQRKPGGYRSPTQAMRALSVIPANRHQEWFQQIWTLGGASTRNHPAPYPLALAERLVRMFSFVSDTVMDPFLGTGTTSLAAGLWGRNSIGVEIEPTYMDQAIRRLQSQLPIPTPLFSASADTLVAVSS